MARRPRPRREYKFWLYKDIQEQVELMKYADHLRKTKQFVTKIRDGLRLIWSLENDDMSVFNELFPALSKQFKPDNSALIEEFREMIKSAIPVQTVQPVGLKPMNVPQISAPIFDDSDEDTIVIRRDENAAKNISMNFLDSVFGLQDNSGDAS